MSFLNSILNIMSSVIVVGGTIYGAIGGVQLGLAIKDHQGPAIGQSIMQLAGAAAIILSGLALANIQFGGTAG